MNTFKEMQVSTLLAFETTISKAAVEIPQICSLQTFLKAYSFLA